MARQCLVATVDRGAKPKELQEPLDEVGTSHAEDLVRVRILPDDDRNFLIGASLADEERVEMLLFLVQNIDEFAWNLYEVPRVDLKFMVQRLNVDPLYPPKKRKPKKLAKEHVEVVKQEVKKLKEVGAIKEIFFPEWLMNTVVVKKRTANGGFVLTSST